MAGIRKQIMVSDVISVTGGEGVVFRKTLSLLKLRWAGVLYKRYFFRIEYTILVRSSREGGFFHVPNASPSLSLSFSLSSIYACTVCHQVS